MSKYPKAISIVSPRSIGSQQPTDYRVIFSNVSDIQSAISSYDYASWYDSMIVYVSDENQQYVWTSTLFASQNQNIDDSAALLPSSVQYSAAWPDIVYAGKSFNFYPLKTGAQSETTISISDVEGLQLALDGKSALNHVHGINDITGLSSTLMQKANVTHTHNISDINNLQNLLNSKANSNHLHNINDVFGLTDALNNKANSQHQHTESDIVDLDKYTKAEIDSLLNVNNSVVDTISDRDALPIAQRYDGKVLYVRETDLTYRLVGGIDNSDWISQVVSEITDSSVTLSKLQDIAAMTVLGRISGTGPVELISILNETDLASNSQTALPTQYSVKQYVDNYGFALDSEVVHIDGIETILGQKTFQANTFFTGNVNITSRGDSAFVPLKIRNTDLTHTNLLQLYGPQGDNDTIDNLLFDIRKRSTSRGGIVMRSYGNTTGGNIPFEFISNTGAVINQYAFTFTSLGDNRGSAFLIRGSANAVNFTNLLEISMSGNVTVNKGLLIANNQLNGNNLGQLIIDYAGGSSPTLRSQGTFINIASKLELASAGVSIEAANTHVGDMKFDHNRAGYGYSFNTLDSGEVVNIDSEGLITTINHGTSENWYNAFSWGNHRNHYVSGDLTTGGVMTSQSNPDNWDKIVMARALNYRPLNATADGAIINLYQTLTNAAQIWVGLFGTRRIMVRNKDGGSWKSWQQLWGTGDFTSTNITNWNTAFGWGDHANAGYLTSVDWSIIQNIPSTFTPSAHTHIASDIISGSFANERISETSVRQHINKTFIDTLGINASALNGQSASYYLNYNNLSNTPTIPTVNDAEITIGTFGVLSGSLGFTLNQSGNASIEITHNNSDLSDGTYGGIGGEFIESITTDTYGHITAITTSPSSILNYTQKTLNESIVGQWTFQRFINRSVNTIVGSSASLSTGVYGMYIIENTATGNFVLTLPDATLTGAVEYKGRIEFVFKNGASVTNLLVSAVGGTVNTPNGVPIVLTPSKNDIIVAISDGTGWFVYPAATNVHI